MAKYILYTFLCAISALTATAQVDAPTTGIIKDTVANKETQTRVLNQNYDNIYLQNARVSTFGNEYGGPIPTQLVADLTGNFVLFATPKSRFAFIFNPRVKLRLLATQGAPVKSPSYMPGGTLYFRLNRNDHEPSFMSLSYSHHSNGVRGPTLNPNGTFNLDSGKFTTNFYTIAYTNGKRVDRGNIITNRYQTLGLELHAGLINLGVAEALKGQYGFVRLNGTWMYNLARARPNPIDRAKTNYNNWMRMQVEFQYIMDDYANYAITNVSKRLNIAAIYYYQFPFMQNVALMAGGGRRGQDDYNIFFQNSYWYLTAGVAAGVSFGFHHEKGE
jgi:hypothetical protein